MKGSASRPSSATMKGTRCAMSPVELRDHHAAFDVAGCRQGRGKLGPPLEGIESLAGFGLHKLPNDRDPLGFAEACHGCPLRLDPEPGTMLPLRGYPKIGDCIAHTNCIPPFAVCMKSEVEQ